ncbi:MAG: exopolyphosphatase/guanosine-5'-triphosphate,3'-diphosphate pyrophosphatase, partial [Dokdonia sp.]
MLEIKKFAAIDIGSNAIRLLITMVVKNGSDYEFKKVSLVRLPIRLGQEAFTHHSILPETVSKFKEGIRAFKIIMNIHEVLDYMAVATSAMREALNGDLLVKQVRNELGIDIQIIDGKFEAEIIFKAHFRNSMYSDNNFVYVDVGGGS